MVIALFIDKADGIGPIPNPEIPATEWAALYQQHIIDQLTSALEIHYDTVAQTRRYDNRLTCALRAGYTGPFQAEGTAFAIWMDTCNAYSYQAMADCLLELRTVPTASELIAELPIIVWP